MVLLRRMDDRENVAQDLVPVATYVGQNAITPPVVLVIERHLGVSVWTAKLGEPFGPASQTWPFTTPGEVVSHAGVSKFSNVAVHSAEQQDPLGRNPQVVFELEVKHGNQRWTTRSIDNLSARKPFAYPALDLDRDHHPEVVYLATESEEMPAYIAVEELLPDPTVSDAARNAELADFRVLYQYIP